MDKRRPLRFYFPMLLALLLVLPAAFLYWANVGAREGVADRRTFRLLASEVEHLTKTLSQMDETISRAGDSCGKDIQHCSGLGPYLEGHLFGALKMANAADEVAFVPAGRKMIDVEGGSSYLYEWWHGNPAFQVRGTLEAVLKSCVSRTTLAQFRSLALVGDDGLVLAQLGKEPVRVTDLEALIDESRVPSSSSKGVEPPQRHRPLRFPGSMKYAATLQGANYFVYFQPALLNLPVYRDAVVHPDGTVGRPTALALVGLVGEKDYSAVTKEVPLAYLAEFSAFALALAGLLAPLLMVRTMTSRERLSKWTCALMAAQFLGAILLMTLVYLSWGFSITVRNRTQMRLEAIADRIRDHMTEELHDALEVVAREGPKLRAKADYTGSSRVMTLESANRNIQDWNTGKYPFFHNLVWTDSDGRNPIEVSMDPRPGLAPTGFNAEDIAALGRPGATARLVSANSTIEFRIGSLDPEISTLTVPMPNEGGFAQMSTRLVSLVGTPSPPDTPSSLGDPIVPYGFAFAVIDETGKVQFHSDKTRNQTEDFFAELDNGEKVHHLVQGRTAGYFEDRYRGVRSMVYVEPVSRIGSTSAYHVEDLNWFVVVLRDEGYIDSLKFEVGKVYFLGFIPIAFLIAFDRLLSFVRTRPKGDALSVLIPSLNWRREWPKLHRRSRYCVGIMAAIVGVLCIILVVSLSPLLRNAQGWTTIIALSVVAFLLKRRRDFVRKVWGLSAWDWLKGRSSRFLGHEGLDTVSALRILSFLIAIPGMAGLVIYSFALNYTQYVHRALLVQQADAALHERTVSIDAEIKSKNLWIKADGIRAIRQNSGIDNYDLFATVSGCKLVDELAGQPQVRLFKLLARIPASIPGGESQPSAYGIGLEPIRDTCGKRIRAVAPPFSDSDQEGPRATGIWPALPAPWVSMEGTIFYAVGLGLLVILGYGVLRVVKFIFHMETPGPEPLQELGDSSELQKLVDEKSRAIVIHQPLGGSFDHLMELATHLAWPTDKRPFVVDMAEEFAGFEGSDLAQRGEDLQRRIDEVSDNLVIIDNLEYRMEEEAFALFALQMLEHLVYRHGQKTPIIALSTIDPQEFLAPEGGKLWESDRRADEQMERAKLHRWLRVLSRFRFWTCGGESLDWRVNEELRDILDDEAEDHLRKLLDQKLERHLAAIPTEEGENLQEKIAKAIKEFLRNVLEERGIDSVRNIIDTRELKLENILDDPTKEQLKRIALAGAGSAPREILDEDSTKHLNSVLSRGGEDLLRKILSEKTRQYVVSSLAELVDPLFSDQRITSTVALARLRSIIDWVHRDAALIYARRPARLQKYKKDLGRIKEFGAKVADALARDPNADHDLSLDPGGWDILKRVLYLATAAEVLVKRQKYSRKTWKRILGQHDLALQNVFFDRRYRVHHRYEDHSQVIREEFEWFDHFKIQRAHHWVRVLLAVLHETGPISTLTVSQFRDELAAKVREEADSVYRRIWSKSCEEERLVLFQLAADGWTNPKNRNALSHLVRRRVVQFDAGEGYWISKSFQWFVRDNQDIDEVNRWIAEQRMSLWSSLRLGFVTLGTLGFFGVLYLGQGLVASYLGTIVAIAGTLLTATQLILELQRKPPQVPKERRRAD